MKVIALCGRSKAGKDFVADRLIHMSKNIRIQRGLTEVVYPKFERHSMASPLKSLLAEILNTTVSQIEWYKDTYRKQLITLSERLKELVPDIWCRELQKKIHNCETFADALIITDVRYYIEVGYLKQIMKPEDLMFIRVERLREQQGCGYQLEEFLEPHRLYNGEMPDDMPVEMWLDLHKEMVEDILEFVFPGKGVVERRYQADF